MDAQTVADLLAREHRSDDVALVDSTGREYDRHWMCTSSWKAGNFLRHAGVGRGTAVGVVGEGPLALLSSFGTALLEGRTRFDPPTALANADDLRALVGPVGVLSDYDLPRGAQRIGYGRKPDASDVRHLEAGLWSENPSFPPVEIDPQTPVLADDDETYSHATIVAAARRVVADWGLEDESRVAIRAPLSNPRTLTGGVIAPLLADCRIELADPTERNAGVLVPGNRSPVDVESIPLEAERD